MSKKIKSIGHVITHTHWDREWRTPVWNSRLRLVEMMEQLLEALDKTPKLRFLFDGQVVAIEDYIEVCPDRRAQIEGLIRTGRIQIGPWYNLPDTFPVCGEALVRNLLIGHRRAVDVGGCLDIAYTTFGWGQPAQFPQIYTQFGIRRAVSAKNVGKHRAPNCEFFWRSPDGSTLLATRLGVEKRANFFFFAVMPATYGQKYADPETQVRWGRGGWFFHSADSNTDSEITFVPEKTYFPDTVPACIRETWDTVEDSLVQEHVFMGNGCDSTAPSEVADRIIEQVNASDLDKELRYSDLKTYFDAIEQVIRERNITLTTVEGELRDGPAPSVSGNALATRMPIKALNRLAQKGLIRYAEAFAALAVPFGIEFPHAFIDKAWQYLLLAHSHDALNGVTLDKTSDDTAYKLKQVIELSQVVTDRTARELLCRADMSAFDKDDILLAVFNPCPREAEQVIEVTVDIPRERRCRWLKAFDAYGTMLAAQPVDHEPHAAPVCVKNSRALPFYADRHRLYLRTGVIPAYGFKLLKLEPGPAYDDNLHFWHCAYEYGSQVTGPNTMENEHLRVTVNSNGTFELTHKSSGRTFSQLGWYEDTGDVGDYWQRVHPEHNTVVNTLGLNAEISLVEDGPLVTTYAIRFEMPVPARAEKPNRFARRRSAEKTNLSIETRLTLRAGSPYLEMSSTVENTARNHTLRVCFPTDIAAKTSDAMGHFHVDSRPIDLPRDENGIRDAGMSTLPMQNFVDLSDGSFGLAVLNNDLIEYDISQDARRTLALTLLRSVDVFICSEGRCATIETGADGPQCLGKHSYHYALMPHAGDWRTADIYGQTERFIHAPRAYQVSPHNRRELPSDVSLLRIDNPNVQLEAVKPAESGEGLAVRLYNPSPEPQTATLHLAAPLKNAARANLNEEPIGPLHPDGPAVTLDLEPYKIVTVLLKQ